MLQARLDELTRAYQLDVANQSWHMQATPHAVRTPGGYPPAALLSELGTSMRNGEEEEGREEQVAEEEDEGYEILSHLRNMQHTTPGSSLDSRDVPATGKGVSQLPRLGSNDTPGGTQSSSHQRVPHPPHLMGAPLDMGGTDPQQRNGHADGERRNMRIHADFKVIPQERGIRDLCFMGISSPPAPPPWDVGSQDGLDRWGQERPTPGDCGGSLQRRGQFAQPGSSARWPPHRAGADHVGAQYEEW
ncbi:hypothetical protein GJAV_G00133940 [Gymnothorax javanicus]|nr:hypothetical protein GJAV_G00133940 [Gymnothorax javanicus]